MINEDEYVNFTEKDESVNTRKFELNNKRDNYILVEGIQKNIYNVIQDGIAVISISGQILDINEPICKITGYSKLDFIHKNIVEIPIKPKLIGQEIQEIIKQIEHGKCEGSYSFIWHHKNGDIRQGELHPNLVTENGKTEGIIAIFIDVTEKNKVVNKLTESEKKYLELFNAASDAIIIARICDGMIVDINNKAEMLIGRKREELIGMHQSMLHPPEDKKKVIREFQQNAKKTENKTLISDTVVLHSSGVRIPVEINTSYIVINGENCLLGIYRDVSERESAEQNAFYERYMMHTIMENITDTIYFKNEKSEFIRINKKMATLFGIKDPAKAIGKTDFDFFTEEHAKQAFSDERNIIKTGKPLLNIVEKETWPSGKITWVSTTKMPLRDANGKITGTFGISRDITPQIQAEKALEESLLNLKLAQRIADIGTWTYNPKTKTPEWSEEIFEILEHDINKGPVLFGKFQTFLDKPFVNSFFRANKQALAEGTPYDIEVILKLGNKKKKWVRIMCHPDAKPSPNGYFLRGTVQDISKQKKVEEDLIEAKDKAEESDRLKSAFLANMSHEIRTPMNGIIGFSKLFMKTGIDPQKREFYANIVIQNSKQLLVIVDDILDISRIETGKVELNYENVNVNMLLAELYDFFENQHKNNEITLFPVYGLEDEESTISTDRTRLRQILMNLLNNAFKFTSKGTIYYGYHYINENLEFFVKDTGIGIPEEMQEIIFEPFRQVEIEITRQHGGTGLGLSISKKLVHLLGGKMWVESTVDAGSIFYFTIPYRKNENKPHDVQQSNELFTIDDNACILIAEDEESNYQYLKEVLHQLKIDFKRAHDGREAINICQSDPAISLVFMDIKMPNVNGYEATREIKKIRPQLPIIALTAFAMKEDKEKAINAGCDDYLSKPVNEVEINSIIRKFSKQISGQE